MVQGANDGQLVGQLGKMLEVLADLHPGHAGRDWLKQPANLRWRRGLHVERIELTRPTPHKQEYARFGPAKAVGPGCGRNRGCLTPCRPQLRKPEPQRAQSAGLQEMTATNGSRLPHVGTATV